MELTQTLPTTSALYLRGDPYAPTDAVFGVKQSLIVSPEHIDAETAEKYGQPSNSKIIRWNFVLVLEREANDLRDANSRKAMEALSRRVKFVNNLPIPDSD